MARPARQNRRPAAVLRAPAIGTIVARPRRRALRAANDNPKLFWQRPVWLTRVDVLSMTALAAALVLLLGYLLASA